jgi:hypothetical protein
VTYAGFSILVLSKGRGRAFATMCSNADVAQLSIKHSGPSQQSKSGVVLTDEADLSDGVVTDMWSCDACVACAVSNVCTAAESADAAFTAEQLSANAAAPCPMRDSVITAVNNVLRIVFSIR